MHSQATWLVGEGGPANRGSTRSDDFWSTELRWSRCTGFSASSSHWDIIIIIYNNKVHCKIIWKRNRIWLSKKHTSTLEFRDEISSSEPSPSFWKTKGYNDAQQFEVNQARKVEIRSDTITQIRTISHIVTCNYQRNIDGFVHGFFECALARFSARAKTVSAVEMTICGAMTMLRLIGLTQWK